MMLKKHLLCGLLAVTTVTTTIAVNVSPSYGQATRAVGTVDDAARNAPRTGQKIWNAVKEGATVIKDGATACALFNDCRDAVNRKFQSQPQQPQQSQQQNQRRLPTAKEVLDSYDRHR
ncbi:MAG: hypothetical protein HC862_30865 [Scytonema sp. RU_4_4]|nr:hypothetical protein [Scytonema sp. RU_4_4]